MNVLVRHRSRAVVCAMALLMLLAGCSDGGGGSDDSPEKVLAAAKEALDETSGVALSLTAEELPADVDGVLEATGLATRAPAFAGDLTIVYNGLEVQVPVVSVGGKVYAKLPFTRSFDEVNPADYGAPDPADLMDPTTGISTWLTGVSGLEEGDRVRDGETVLKSYTGSLPGEVVVASIPSAAADAEFPASFQIDDDGRLRSVEISGPFYGSKGTVEYTISVDDYGTDTDIKKP